MAKNFKVLQDFWLGIACKIVMREPALVHDKFCAGWGWNEELGIVSRLSKHIDTAYTPGLLKKEDL